MPGTSKLQFNRLSTLAAKGQLKGKKVFIRADLNVPQDEAGNITEDTRIRASIPAIKLALDAGAAVMVTSHLGRPTEGEFKPEDSLAPVAKRLGELLGREVPLIKAEFGGDYQVVYPKSTVLAENPVSVVDRVVDKRGTRREAEAYLRYLWSDEGQALAVKHNLRPRSAGLLGQNRSRFPKVNTFTVDEVFGSWRQAQSTHFNDGGVFDQIYTGQ